MTPTPPLALPSPSLFLGSLRAPLGSLDLFTYLYGVFPPLYFPITVYFTPQKSLGNLLVVCVCGGGGFPWSPCPRPSSPLPRLGPSGPPRGPGTILPSCGGGASVCTPLNLCVPRLFSSSLVGDSSPPLPHSVGHGIQPSPLIFFVCQVGHSMGIRWQPRQLD